MVNIGKAYELFGQLNVPLNSELASWLEVRPTTLAALPNRRQKHCSCAVAQLVLLDVFLDDRAFMYPTAPRAAQDMFMRLLMRHPPSDNFDDVSVVLFLVNRAVMGRLTPGQCRSAVDMAAARGGMRYFADTTWKGLEVLLVRP